MDPVRDDAASINGADDDDSDASAGSALADNLYTQFPMDEAGFTQFPAAPATTYELRVGPLTGGQAAAVTARGVILGAGRPVGYPRERADVHGEAVRHVSAQHARVALRADAEDLGEVTCVD